MNTTEPTTADNHDTDPRYQYLAWLHMEARILRHELFPEMDGELEFTPRIGAVSRYHFPSNMSWMEAPQPSTRAAIVLAAVGFKMEDAA